MSQQGLGAALLPDVTRPCEKGPWQSCAPEGHLAFPPISSVCRQVRYSPLHSSPMCTETGWHPPQVQAHCLSYCRAPGCRPTWFWGSRQEPLLWLLHPGGPSVLSSVLW